jgi:extradiol dioxygenase family protein
MNNRYIFHLSIPVSDLDTAKRFYVDMLGAAIGRETDEWLDVLLWGHQITLQRRPSEVLPLEQQGKRHFGVVLPWSEWERLADHLKSMSTSFLSEPEVLLKGTPEEQAKFYLMDPSHNIIEIKTYRDMSTTLGQQDGSYSYKKD